jgi:uncharacterized protein
MRVDTVTTAAAFAEVATPFLATHEVEHGLMLGLARAAADAGTPIAWSAVARDGAGAVVGATLRTHDTVLLSREGVPGAAAALARDALAPALAPGVARAGLPAALADAFAAASGVAWRTERGLWIHELRAVVPPPPVPGARRVAGAADRETLVGWVTAFRGEASGEPAGREEVERAVDARLAADSLHVWDVDGRPTALAGWAGPTPTGVRVNMVYTPPAERGRGWASALVASLSQHLLDGGRAFVFLFTDPENPTANAVYRRIGYRRVAEWRMLARG